MDAHGTPEYSTAAGNDYAAHEATYKGFTFLVLIGICYVVNLAIALAVGGVKGAWGTEAGLIIFATIVAAPGPRAGRVGPGGSRWSCSSGPLIHSRTRVRFTAGG